MSHRWGYMAALTSALTYGIGYAVSKMLLLRVSPALLAAIVYLSSASYLLVLRMLPERLVTPVYAVLNLRYRRHLTLGYREFAILLAVSLVGSSLAPYLFLLGLELIPAVDASLLSITELVFVFLIAALFSGERYGVLELMGVAAISVGVLLVSVGFEATLLAGGDPAGYILVVSGCFFWAVDTVVSRLLTLRGDVVEVAGLKSLFGGLTLLLFSLIVENITPPDWHVVFTAIFVGVVSVGNSLFLFFAGLYHVGSGRTMAIFSTYTIFGALWAHVLLGESLELRHAAAASIILSGVFLMYKSYSRSRVEEPHGG